jgi:hypothetical protein
MASAMIHPTARSVASLRGHSGTLAQASDQLLGSRKQSASTEGLRPEPEPVHPIPTSREWRKVMSQTTAPYWESISLPETRSTDQPCRSRHRRNCAGLARDTSPLGVRERLTLEPFTALDPPHPATSAASRATESHGNRTIRLRIVEPFRSQGSFRNTGPCHRCSLAETGLRGRA